SAIHPRADAQGGGVDIRRRDDRGPDRCEAITALRAQVGAFVGIAQVVHAEVVRGRNARNMRPTVLGGYASGGLADDEGDLALEGEQFATCRPFESAASRQ